MNSKVLVVIDIQKEYITHGRPFYLENIETSLENATRMLAHARSNGWKVIHVQHLQEGSIFNANDEHSDFISEFEPRVDEEYVVKNDYSSYSAKEFRSLMEKHIDLEIHVIGYGSTLCCLSTIIDGYHRGNKFVFIKDASLAKRGTRFDELTTHEHASDIISNYAKVKLTLDVIN